MTPGPTDEKPRYSGSFVDYQKAVLDLSNDLRQLRQHVLDLGLEGSANEISGVLERMARNRFSVAVVGEFKRGKSTFINALLGVDVLPTDVLPCSATLNRVTYGIEKRAELTFNDGHVETIPLEALPDYVTKLSTQSEARAAEISEAKVFYPSPYTLNNVDVIDTPGLNEDQAMTAVTLRVLPEVDAAILVITAQSPFGEHERDFLEYRLLSADLGRVIFVVNGIDRLNSPEDADRVVAGIERRIRDNVLERAKVQFGENSPDYETYVRKIGKPRVFGLSAREALEGKKSGSLARLEASGFPRFERQLEKFLTEHKGVVQLHVPLNRCIASSRSLLEAIAMRENALAMDVENFDRAMTDASALIERCRAQWIQERAAMEDAGLRVRTRAEDLGVLFLNELRDATAQAVNGMSISNDDLGSGSRKSLDKRLGTAVSKATSQVTDKYSQRLQAEMELSIQKEAERLSGFDIKLSGLMGEISSRFSGLETTNSSGRLTEGVLAGLAAFTMFGGIWSGYRSAGWKGAGVGLGASAATAFAGGAVAALLGLSAAALWPIVIAAGILSIFTGGWLSDVIFEGSRVQTYKDSAIKAVRKQLDKELGVDVVKGHFREAAANVFAAFQKSVTEASEARLEDTTLQLLETRDVYSRNRQSKEQDRTSTQVIRSEVEGIAARAIALSHLLVTSDAI